MKRALILSVPLSLALPLSSAHAAILTVGSGSSYQYATPCAAIAAAQPNDEVDVAPGTYTDTCSIAVAGLTVKGVGGMPKIDLTNGTPYGDKGIYVIDADGVTLENLELTGATISSSLGENGAGVRIEAQNLTIRGCYIHDNQDGVLGGPPTLGGSLLIEGTELSHNGLGNGCDDTNAGCTHNVYISANVQTFTFQYNWSHDLATDTPDKGHLLKSRAQQTYVLYNRMTGETDTDSYEIDIPQAGLAVVVGNMVQKPSTAGNPHLLSYGEESLANGDTSIYVVNNTFVTDLSGATFLWVASGATLVAHDNLFVGMGTPSNTGALSADNLLTMAPLFVDQAGYDYHLTATSPARGLAVAPGSAGTFSLVPTEEYVQPTSDTARTADEDVGAFEYGAVVSGTGGSTSSSAASGAGGGSASSSGAGGSSAASTTSGSSGSLATSSATGSTSSSGSSGTPSKSSGCSCGLPGERSSDGRDAFALLASIGLVTRLIRRRRG